MFQAIVQRELSCFKSVTNRQWWALLRQSVALLFLKAQQIVCTNFKALALLTTFKELAYAKKKS
jgi:hypothetical protein